MELNRWFLKEERVPDIQEDIAMKHISLFVVALLATAQVSAGVYDFAGNNPDLYGDPLQKSAMSAQRYSVPEGYGDSFAGVRSLIRERQTMHSGINRGTNDAYASPLLENNPRLDW